MKTKKQYMQLTKNGLVNLLIAKDSFLNMLGKEINKSKIEIDRLCVEVDSLKIYSDNIENSKEELLRELGASDRKARALQSDVEELHRNIIRYQDKMCIIKNTIKL